MTERYEVEVGPVAHGGHCVARLDGRAVFVRHALPGERVLIEITEGGPDDRFWRADAVEVMRPSPDRVRPPCPLAGPGLCGGCDFQHASLPAQRALKAAVVQEQLSRLAGLSVDVEVEEVQPTLRWRSRMQYVGLPGGARGLRKHRSHEVVEVDDCLIAAPDAREVTHTSAPRRSSGAAPFRWSSAGGEERAPGVSRPSAGDTDTVTETVVDKSFRVAADGFWQVHPAAPTVLVEAVLDFLEPQPGERAVDLYAGVGLFSAFLADHVGPTGAVLSVEGDRRASAHAADNLASYPQAEVRQGDVARVLQRVSGGADLVVLDPPRTGAKRKVVLQIADLEPRAIAYVACDPAALARDVAYFAEAGYRLENLRAFDLFPMTHHVECVALLTTAAQPE